MPRVAPRRRASPPPRKAETRNAKGPDAAVRPFQIDQAESASFERSARLRSFGSRTVLRRRIDFGVTSTSSSSWIQARDFSSVIRIGGGGGTAPSLQGGGVLVGFFSLCKFTPRAFSRVWSPLIMP